MRNVSVALAIMRCHSQINVEASVMTLYSAESVFRWSVLGEGLENSYHASVRDHHFANCNGAYVRRPGAGRQEI